MPHKDNPINELNSSIITAKEISKGPPLPPTNKTTDQGPDRALNQTPITLAA